MRKGELSGTSTSPVAFRPLVETPQVTTTTLSVTTNPRRLSNRQHRPNFSVGRRHHTLPSNPPGIHQRQERSALSNTS